jgi:hypothetical protein
MKSLSKKSILIASLAVSATSFADVSATMYGTVNVGIMGADRVVKSYGKDVLAAPTEAGRESGAHMDGQNRTSIQSAQSKFGWNFKASEQTTGVLELDMVDFSKGTPTTHILRVRKASFQHQFDEDSKIRIGKDFSIFNAVGPHTSNWVGGSYRAGNTGFILDEMVYFKKISSFELMASIGNFGRNFAESFDPSDSPSELSFPSATLRLENRLEMGRWGFAYIGSDGAKWELINPANKNTKAYAAKLYADLNFWGANWRLSAYQGTNTADLALLGLAGSKQGTSFINLNEQGAFLSVQHAISDKLKLYWGLSHAEITNPEEGLKANTLRKNQVSRLGYKYELEKGLESFIEFTEFRSGFALADSSAEVTSAKSTLGHAGFLYHF